jgi:hypothetical protein
MTERKKTKDIGGDKTPTGSTAKKFELEPHPLALLFPALDEDAFGGLCADIDKNGQIHPIVALGDQILDGWHRYKACLKTGVAPMVHQFSGTNPAAYVLSANLHRRHLNLTTEQKRELIARVLKENPELSDRVIGKITRTDGKTVASERTNLESRAEIRTSETRTDSKGRKQPARKSASKSASKPAPKPAQIEAPAAQPTTVPAELGTAQTESAPAGECRASVVNGARVNADVGAKPAGRPVGAIEALRALMDLLAVGTPKGRLRNSSVNIVIAATDVERFDQLLDDARAALERPIQPEPSPAPAPAPESAGAFHDKLIEFNSLIDALRDAGFSERQVIEDVPAEHWNAFAKTERNVHNFFWELHREAEYRTNVEKQRKNFGATS